MKTIHGYLVIGTLICSHVAAPSCAQPSVDIGLYPGVPGQLELRITPSGDFDGLLSALSFTIGRKDDGIDRSMTMEQTDDMRQLVALGPSGGEYLVGSERYRIFSGIGMTTLASTGMTWHGGISYTVATIATPGGDLPYLVNNDWAKDRRNNGAYYISLNGLDRTGQVVSPSAQHDEGNTLSVTVTPNPWRGGPLNVDVLGAPNGEISIELSDTEGKIVVSRTAGPHEPAFRTVLRPGTELSAGTFLLSVRTSLATRTIPLVIAEGRQ